MTDRPDNPWYSDRVLVPDAVADNPRADQPEYVTISQLKAAKSLHDCTIRRACFSIELEASDPADYAEVDIWPKDAANITFVRCNLGNVKLPPGSVLVDCSRRRFMPRRADATLAAKLGVDEGKIIDADIQPVDAEKLDAYEWSE